MLTHFRTFVFVTPLMNVLCPSVHRGFTLGAYSQGTLYFSDKLSFLKIFIYLLVQQEMIFKNSAVFLKL